MLEIPNKYITETSEIFAKVFKHNEWKWITRKSRQDITYIPTSKDISEEIVKLLYNFEMDTNAVESGRIRIDRSEDDITISLIADSVSIPIKEVKEVLKVDVDDIQS